MLIPSLALITILFLLLVWATIRERVMAKEIKLAKQFYAAIWNNAHEFIFLIDKTSHVTKTNYYTVCKMPPREDRKCFGEILQCRYAREADNCNKHEKCRDCIIRSKISETFKSRGSFSNFETTMDIQISSRPAGLYSMMVSGRYLSLNGHDYVILTVHDISEERALESSLKHSNEKFLCFFENATVGCAICDKEGTLIEVNDAYVEYMGLSSKADAVNQLNIYTNPCINPEFKEMMRTGIPVSGEVKYDYEIINRTYVKSRHKDVHYFRFIVNYLRDAAGNVENILIVWVENTLIHKTLRQNKNFHEMIGASSSASKIGFSSINLLKNEQLVTPEYLRNLGISEEIDLRTIFSHMKYADEDASWQQQVFMDYVEKAKHERVEPLERNIHLIVDGEPRWIKQYLIQQTFDPDNGNIVLLGVNVDINEQKKTEEALREAKEKAESSDKLKSAFVANMSHEIRTPLNAIVGFANLLVTSEDKEDFDNFKQIIEQNSNQLLQLIGDILDLSKIESDTLDFVWSNVNINAMMYELEKIFQMRNAANPDVVIKCVASVGDCVIRTDRQRLIQVVSNLMTNAIKFTTQGSIIMGYEKRKEEIYFYVKDTGCGIPEENQSQIFERFVQLDSFKQGTGLGLYIIEVKNVSKFFGDKIALDNINLYVKKGEFVTILGPSGCGKTTLLRLIAGFQTASEGEIRIAGQEITQTPPHKRPVNTVFQKYALFPHLNVYDNIAFGLKLKKLPKQIIEKKVKAALRMVGMTDYEYRDVNSLSGGQQQRVAIARAIVNEPEVLLLDEPLAALDLKMRKDMQMELKEMHKTLGITFVYVTHDQEEALTLSDTIVVMSEGRIQQIGTPVDIYNEPINSFVADFIGESNILNGIMIKDKLVRFAGVEFECVDEGFGENMPVDVVVRPEDWYIFPLSDAAQITGTVTSSIFKGVHYEMVVVANGYEFIVQDYHHFDVGQEVGLLVKPFDIHIMKKERVCNSFEGEMIDESHVDFLGCHFECLPVKDIEPGEKVKVVVAFKDIILHDNEEDGTLTGDVRFILYKGDHYHLTVSSDWGEDIYVDTNDVWDNGDHVGISILPEKIKIIKVVD